MGARDFAAFDSYEYQYTSSEGLGGQNIGSFEQEFDTMGGKDSDRKAGEGDSQVEDGDAITAITATPPIALGETAGETDVDLEVMIDGPLEASWHKKLHLTVNSTTPSSSTAPTSSTAPSSSTYASSSSSSSSSSFPSLTFSRASTSLSSPSPPTPSTAPTKGKTTTKAKANKRRKGVGAGVTDSPDPGVRKKEKKKKKKEKKKEEKKEKKKEVEHIGRKHVEREEAQENTSKEL